ncbi:MAG: esterase-like activity of phytase family protein, partial [Cronobacter sakazakii]|nr:esterase-like activity of phytase family protein [Cronobacter sakazakii]
KAEGLALIDPQTLAVINDNDFGLQSELLEPQGDKKEMDDYNVDGQGHLTLDGKPVASKIGIKPLEKPASQNELWVIKLDKPL